METGAASALLTGAGNSPATNPVGELSSEDFFNLLITELRQQDPLEPMDNAKLLEQISSVREIELNATLTDSLQSLVGERRFGSASALLGQFVTTGNEQGGLVTAVRFREGEVPMLQLSDGTQVALDQIASVESALEAAERLVGRHVTGLDRRDVLRPEVAEGVVAGVRMDKMREVVLELDSGADLRFRDVVAASDTADV